MRFRHLELFCGGGGSAVGYARAYEKAGIEVEILGVDIAERPRFPFDFIRADALTFPLSGFDVIAASPPCHEYTPVSGRAKKGRPDRYPDLLAPTRARLVETGTPYVIENVATAPILKGNAVMLCGSSFGLDVRRHRWFESNLPLMGMPCQHSLQRPRFRSPDSRQKTLATVVGVHGHLNYSGEFELRKAAMGIDWMTPDELTQAIPPAFTEFIGSQLIAQLEAA